MYKCKCPFYENYISLMGLEKTYCITMQMLQERVKIVMCDVLLDEDEYRFFPGTKKICPAFKLGYMKKYNYLPS